MGDTLSVGAGLLPPRSWAKLLLELLLIGDLDLDHTSALFSVDLLQEVGSCIAHAATVPNGPAIHRCSKMSRAAVQVSLLLRSPVIGPRRRGQSGPWDRAARPRTSQPKPGNLPAAGAAGPPNGTGLLPKTIAAISDRSLRTRYTERDTQLFFQSVFALNERVVL